MRFIYIFPMTLLAVTLLAGCSLWQTPAPEPAAPLPPLLQFMASHTKGDNTTLDDPVFGEGISVTIQDTFTSAAGEQCRRATLLSKDGQTEIVVACLQHSGDTAQWVMAPRIWGQGLN